MHLNPAHEHDQVQVHIDVFICFVQVILVVLELLVFAAAENQVVKVTAFKAGWNINLTVFL